MRAANGGDLKVETEALRERRNHASQSSRVVAAEQRHVRQIEGDPASGRGERDFHATIMTATI